MKEHILEWKDPASNYPARVFRALKSGNNAVLLESARVGIHDGFSYIALDPHTTLKTKESNVWINGVHKVKNPLEAIQELLRREPQQRPKGFPLFYAGAIGYLGYDLKNVIEPKLRTTAQDDTGFWDCYMIFPRTVIGFDHLQSKIYVNSENDGVTSELEQTLASKPEKSCESQRRNPRIHTNISFEQYRAMFNRALDYVRSGDTYQVKLSIRHDAEIADNPLNIYDRLRRINPSPYAAFLDLEDICLVSCSPEELLRLENRIAETRPIGGTYPRGRTDEDDSRVARAFYEDAKERAEHVMLIDLERNDLGRVCKPGSVRVTEPMALEKYSHLMHIVTTIRGELSDSKDSFDLVKGMFPGGTITGCPKIRTMDIIDELEPVARGPYTGSIGFFTPCGDAQFNIIIRTLVIDKKLNRGYIQVGGGIVADSTAEYEHQENLRKGAALLEAL